MCAPPGCSPRPASTSGPTRASRTRSPAANSSSGATTSSRACSVSTAASTRSASRSHRAMPRIVRILALLGFVLAAATPVAAQGPLARTYAAYGFRALGSGDFGGAVREFTEALELYPLYVDAYVGRAMAGIAQDRLLEAWGDLQRAKRYDDDPGRKAAIEELMQGVEVTSRLASYAAFLAGAKRDADA